ncbi:uncharacterized protein [Solanum lycopersicum]|uniref:uncharacterized protein n=1 Tax=Solanum lycopersicum TaxID=4081 RepID=UPI003748948A
MVTIIMRVIMFEMETTTMTTTLTEGNYAYRNDNNGPYVPSQNRETPPRDGGDSMARVEDMLHKMMRRFGASDDHIKEIRGDLASIGQKVDTHAILIKQIELQMAQLSAIVNTRQSGTLPNNSVQNQKNDAHCMEITTRGKALEQMPGYAKFMKDLVTKKRSVTFEDDDRLQHCCAIATRSLVQKKEDPGAFTIPWASITLMPLSIYKKLGLGDPKPTAIRQLMADRTVKRPIGILHDVLVKVESFIFPGDFAILDCEVDFEVPIILGRPFLARDNSGSPCLPGKLKSKWTGPYLITQVVSTMAPKQDRIYKRERSKSVASCACMVIGSDDERDPYYVPPGTSTPSCTARAPRATPKKVASNVFTASLSDEERTLTGTPSGSATNDEGASGSLGVSWSEEASGSSKVVAPATAAPSASSDEADSSESTLGSPAQAPTPATDQPNQ